MKINFTHLRRLLFTLIMLACTASILFGQVAINTDGSGPDNSAMLDVKSSDKGILIPRLTTIQRTTLSSTAVAGLMVYDTDVNKFFFFNGVTWDEGSVGNLWSSNGSNIYPTNAAGRIGIGFSTPTYDVDVNKSANSAFMRVKSTSGFAGLIIDKASPGDNGYLVYQHNGSGDWYVGTVKNTDFAISTSYSAADGKFYIEQSTGNVGIGTTTPARTLEIAGPWQTARLSSTSSGATLEFVSTTKNDWAISTWYGNMALIYSTDDFVTKTDEYYFTPASIYPYASNTKSLGTAAKQWSNLYSVDGVFTGNMAIGSVFATGYKLSVSGKIICEELRVNAVADWPDYVFGKQYKLMSLHDLDLYIQTNGHLPNVPSAGEVNKSGVDVGEMQRLMMEKIEELSLYVIRQQKQIDELEKQLKKNKKQ